MQAAEKEHILELISACLNQNRRAQEQLYKLYYEAMMSICLRYTRNSEDAVEVLNTGFLKIFTSLGKYESKFAFYTWIRTVMIRCCVDHLRSTKIHHAHSVAQSELQDGETYPSYRLEWLELLELSRSLPAVTQAVFNLYDVEGYAHSEIASLLQISPGTSRWHLHQARLQMRQLITKKQQVHHG